MGFLSVRPFNFRNLEDRRVPCDAPQVFLVGDNGQGKTNFIEAVHVLCYGSSFRTRQDRRLVRHGEERAAIEGVLRVPGGVEVEINVQIGASKRILVNGKPIRDRTELLANAPCIVFSHDDFDFVNGTPERRRWFLDQTLSLADPLYLPALRAYRHVLAARNVLLREGNGELLVHYDRQIARYGFEVQAMRRTAFDGFGEVFRGLFGAVSGIAAEVCLRYLPSWEGAGSADEASALLERRRKLDLRLGTTTAGPHRDSYAFSMEEHEFDHVASTGQLRLCALTLRVAQAHYLLARTGKMPILLLDDVILELDAARKQAFVENLPGRDQAFFTFLADEEFGRYRRGGSLTYRVSEGRIQACSA